MNAITTRATHEYLTRVRTALADISPSEVDDLLDDVRPHLADIAAEIGPECTLRDMIARLGTPEQYAAELRAAGDYPPAPAEGEPVRKSGGVRFALWSMLVTSFFLFCAGAGALADGDIEIIYAGVIIGGFIIGLGAFRVARRPAEALDALPEVDWFRKLRDSSTGSYLRSLAPGWWIGAALIFICASVLMIRQDPWDVAAALPIFAILAGLVVFAGHRVAANRTWMWVTVPLSALAVGAVLGGLGAASSTPIYNEQFGGMPNLPAGLFNDGEEVTNIFGFTKDGQPITEFYLVDQNGQSIKVGSLTCGTDGAVAGATDNRFPKPIVKVDGQDVPRSIWGAPPGEPLQYGECKETNETPFTIAIPQTSASAPTTTTAPATETPVTPAPEVTTEPVPTP